MEGMMIENNLVTILTHFGVRQKLVVASQGLLVSVHVIVDGVNFIIGKFADIKLGVGICQARLHRVEPLSDGVFVLVYFANRRMCTFMVMVMHGVNFLGLGWGTDSSTKI